MVSTPDPRPPLVAAHTSAPAPAPAPSASEVVLGLPVRIVGRGDAATNPDKPAPRLDDTPVGTLPSSRTQLVGASKTTPPSPILPIIEPQAPHASALLATTSEGGAVSPPEARPSAAWTHHILYRSVAPGAPALAPTAATCADDNDSDIEAAAAPAPRPPPVRRPGGHIVHTRSDSPEHSGTCVYSAISDAAGTYFSVPRKYDDLGFCA
ncbi:unnamed protein product [Phytophthora fragariaefolia]|uniref:Unnamed protein product n=1 Tax=Phytophthora fragariaefolia TaxID=1490495 RepID=A0A9W7D846_9STRA|nr:unnamed protein product [Phytophthora fragariaefolia]